jgi:DNA-binding transcriptional LysR family regulator
VLLDRNVALVEDHVDMAIRIGKLPDSTMISTTIGSFRTVICGSPELFARQGVPRNAEEFQRLPCVTFDGPLPSPGWQLHDPKTKIPIIVPITSRLSVTTIEAALRAAVLHVGVTRLLCYQVVDSVSSGRLQVVLKRFEPEAAPVSIIHAARGQMPIKTRVFLDFATPRLRKLLVVINCKM